MEGTKETKQPKKVGIWALTCIFIAYGVSLNTFSVGSAQAGHMTFWDGVIMIIIGWLGLAIFGALSGEIGFLSGSRGPDSFKAVYGKWGYKLPSIAASLALLGFSAFDYWYVGMAFRNLLPGLGNWAFYIGILVIVLAAVFGSIKDITSLKWLTSSTVPIALVLFFIILFATVNRGGGWEVLMNYKPTVGQTTMILGANIMFSCWSSTIPGFMDFTSQAKSRKAVWIAIPIGMLVIAFQYFVGQIGTYAMDIVDFTSLAAALGGGLGLVCNLFTLFAQGNTVPATTIMITSHMTSSLRLPRLSVIIGQPLIAAALAIAMFLGADIGIINVFGTFVGFLFAPLLGSIFAEFYVIGKKSFRKEEDIPRICLPGVITLIIGFAAGVVINYVIPVPLPAAFILIPFCFLLHLFLRKVCRLDDRINNEYVNNQNASQQAVKVRN